MSQAMCFRPMQRGDVSRIAQLERICFRSPWSEKSLLGEVKNPVAHYRVGILDADIQAYGGMWIYFGEAHLTNVAVAPEYRRQGYGRALMLDLIQTALLHGAERMTLEVREHNQGAPGPLQGLGV